MQNTQSSLRMRAPTAQTTSRRAIKVQCTQGDNRPFAIPAKSTEKLAAGLLGAAAAITLALAPPAFAREPFLKSTGARGLLAQEEEELLKLRQEKEAVALQEFEKARETYQEEVRSEILTEGQLCATPFGIDVVGITEFVALTGALVGGISARKRKEELEKLNEQLRTINSQLRQQARAGTLYAPGLTYAPIGTGANGAEGESDAAVAAATTVTIPKPIEPPVVTIPPPLSEDSSISSSSSSGSFAGSEPVGVSLMSIDEEDSPEAKQCQNALKEGKKLLKDKNSGAAMVRFEKALMLAKSLGDKVRERRAVRGLAAACRLAGQNRQAIKYLERVLEISNEVGEHTGDSDAVGVMGDIFADMGEFEKAAECYDKYITKMNTDGVV